MSEYFPEPKSSGGRVKGEFDLSNYATKKDLRNATGATSKFAKKVDLANLKSDADKLDTDKLKNVPTNLSNLKSKVDKLNLDELVPVPVDLCKLSDIVIQSKKTDHNRKISETEKKISIDHDHDKYITAQEFNTLIAENLIARLAQPNLASKNDFANFVKKRYILIIN